MDNKSTDQWHGKYPGLYTPLKVEIVKPKKDEEQLDSET